MSEVPVLPSDQVIDRLVALLGPLERVTQPKCYAWPMQPIVRGVDLSSLPRPERLYASVTKSNRRGGRHRVPASRARERSQSRPSPPPAASPGAMMHAAVNSSDVQPELVITDIYSR